MIDFELEKKKDEIRGKALRKISFSQKTEKEMRAYLIELGYSEDLVEDTVSFLKDFKYINDISYAASFYRREKGKMKGIRRIESELLKKGISKSDIEKAFMDMEDDEDSEFEPDIVTARKLKDKMVREQLAMGKDLDDRFKSRVMRRLMSKGYDTGTCYRMLGEIKK